MYIKAPLCEEIPNFNVCFSFILSVSVFFKELRYRSGSQAAKPECVHVVATELSLLIIFLGNFKCCSCLMTTVLEKNQVLIHGLYLWRNLQQTWNHNGLERALAVSLGAGVCETSNSTITGLPCRGRQGAFPDIFE